jgi:RNA polymerase sigma-70 factor (ECF subfamily)
VSPDCGDEFLRHTLPALDLVFNLARRMVASPMDAEDLVQETYVRAFEAWRDGRRPRQVRPWLATICLNLARSWARRSSVRREVPVDLREEQLEAGSAEVEALSLIEAGALRDALWRLPEEQRIAITLMDLGGLTAREVATITRSPRGTVLARVHRGRKKLAELLGQEVSAHET